MSSLFARAVAVGLVALGLPAVILADTAPTLSLSPTGYTMVSQVRADRNHFFYTYTGVLLNTGPALTGVTATLTSSSSSVQVVSGQSTLEFSPVPAGTLAIASQATSTNTFTILVDRTVPFSFSDLVWAFNNPFADPGPAQTVPVLSTVTLNGTGSTNPGGIGTLTYSWAFQTVPTGSIAQIQNANSATATFVPDLIGTYVLELTVSNGPQSNTATVTISTTDVPPTANAGPNQTVVVGGVVTLDGTKSSDANGQPLSFLWSFVGVPTNSAAVLSNPRSPKPSFVADKDGTYILGLVVNDGTLGSNQSTVTISTGNTAPVAVATANPQSVNVNGLVQLDGSKSTDVNSNALTYSWSLNTSGATGSKATLSDLTIVNPTFTADVPGTYIAQLIVNDGVSSSKPATITVTTNTVLPPTANAGSNQQVTAGATVQLQGSGTDPQGLPLTFNWSLTTVPQGSTASLSVANIANPTFVADLPGTYVAQLVVKNGVLSSNPQTVTITSTSLPPVAVPSTTTPVVSLGQLVLLSGSQSTDPQGFPLTYSWSLSVPSGSNATLTSLRSQNPSFTPDVVGTYVAQLIVNDGFQSSQPQTVSVSAGLMTIALTPSPMNLTNSPQPLTVTISPGAGATGVTVGLSGFDGTVIKLSSNSVTIPANSSSANVTVTPLAAGNTGIIASAPGYASATDQVSVKTPTITIAFNNGATGVGITHTLGGTISLGAPAPQPDGTTVTLSVDPSSAGSVSFSPTSVLIPAGSTTGTFSVTGTQLGNVNIDANAAGYTQAQASVLVVNLGGISISQNLTVGVGESQPLSVTLSTPAPVDGVTLNLKVSDPNTITVSPSSVTIAPGAKTPATPPQVTGVALGSATITASAGGYAGDTENVTVSSLVVFAPTSLTVAIGSQQSFNVQLSSPAPASGLVVTLSSNNGNATVTPTVTFTSGQQSLPASVTGVSSGTSTITATTNNPQVSGVNANLAVTITNALALPCPTTTSGEVNAPFSSQFSATGGSQPYTYSVVGTLPQGLTLSGTGLVSGTPSASGSFNIKVTDANGITATSCSITISTALALPCPGSTGGDVGVVFNSQLSATGGVGPYTYSVVGTLPNGLSLNSSTGVISGSPTATGSFTVKVTDSIGGTATSCTFTISQALALPCPTASVGDVDAPFSAQLSPSGGTAPYTFTVVGTLPDGLTLSAAGLVSGTPTAAGNFSVKVTDAVGATITACQFTINTALAVPCPTITSGEIGTAFSSQIMPTGGTAPYTFTLIGTALPTGITVNSSTGLISGTPTSVGVFEVQVKDAAGVIVNSCKLKIATALSLPCPGSTGGDVGVVFNSQLSATGGVGPYTYSVVGTLPNGLSLDSSTGVISGSPTATGSFTVKVTDSIGGTATSCTFTISPALALPCPTASVGEVGAPFSAQLSPSGGTAPYTFTVVGTLPGGLTLNGGLVSGTPTAAGNFSVKVTDAAGATITVCQFTINTALAVPCPAITSGEIGTAFSSQIVPTGGTAPYTFSLIGTALPTGITLNSSTGLISGTPTSVGVFEVQVKDATGVIVNSCKLRITTAVSLPCPGTTSGEQGVAFSSQLSASGGTAPYTYTVVGTLPSGLSLNASTGLVNGTPTQAGTFSVQVKDANGVTATSCAFTISGPFTLPCPATTGGEIGAAFSSQLSAAGGVSPYTYSVVGTLPGGLSLNVSTGLVSGTPTSAGSFTVQAKDSAGATATSCTITIATALALPCPTTTTGEVGTPFSSQVTASGGVGPYTYAVNGVLPGGLTVNSSTGLISGTPTASGSFKIQVKDSLGFTVITGCSLTINGSVSLPCPTTPTTGEVNVAFSSQLSASGGVGPYTYTVVGTLPQGLSLNAATGLVSGTPTTAGTFSVQAKDANGATATSCAFTIVSAVSLPSPATTTGEMGIAFNAQLAATGGVTPYTYAAVGLPSGLTLNSSTGAIGGTPTAAGSFSVKVTDALGATATSSAFTIAATLTLPCPGTTKGDQGVPFSAQLTAANGVAPYTFSVVAGSLPTGLTLNPSTGLVSGTPQGSATFSIKATDALGATATSCTFTIAGPLSLPCPGNVTGEVGAPFSGQFQALGGTPAYTYSVVGTLPNGLTLNTSTGAITGTPTGAGSFSVQVKDATGATVTSACSVNIVAMVTLTCPGTNSGAIGSPFSATMTPAGGILPYALSLQSGTLPTGLTLTGNTISGTPSAAGNFTFKLTDGAGVLAATTCNFTISTVSLQFQTTSLPNGAPNVAYSATVTAIGGTTPYTFSLGTGAPSWLQINPVTGVITGNPSRGSGTFNVPVTVADSSTPTQQTVSKTFTLTISQTPLAFVTTSLPDGTVGLSYSQQIVVTGGTTPYNWQITPVQPAQLPAWFTFDPTGAQCASSGPTICGTPPAFGSVTFTLKVTDNTTPAAQTVSNTFTLTIDPVTGPATLSLVGGTGVSNTFSVGQNLEVPITLTFNPIPAGNVQVTLTSNSGGMLTFTGTPQPQGSTPPAPTSTFTITITPQSSVTFYVQGVGSSGTFTITAQVPNYKDGTATVNLGNSGFVLSSSAGIGASFDTFEGVTTPLTLGPALLNGSGLFVEYELIAYQQSFTVPLTVAPGTLGSVSPASFNFTSGMGSISGGSGGPNFKASSTNSGGATISIQTQPTGFVNPLVGSSVNANVQKGGFVAPAVTVGNNLQVQTSFTMNSPAASQFIATLHSNDSTRLQFSATEMGAGSTDLPLTVPQGQITGPNFWVRVYDPSNTNAAGSVGFTISGGSLGTTNGTVTIGPSGLVIQSPGGLGSNFAMTPSTPSATLTVFTALMNGSNVVATQEVAADQSISVKVESGTPATGAISSSPLTIAGANGSATTTFVPSQAGSSTITASSVSGFQPSGTPIQSGSVSVTVTSCSLNINNGLTVGQFLEQQGTVFLSCAAGAGGVPVTLKSNSAFVKLAVNATDPGSDQIVVTVKNGFTATYWVYGLGTGLSTGEGASPATVTYGATATGYASGTDTVTLAPSAILISGPSSAFGSFSASVSAGAKTLTVWTDVLTTDGSNTPTSGGLMQPLAGNVALIVSLTDSAAGGAGTLSSNSATIAPGAGTGTVTFTPAHAGNSTNISVTQPTGWIGTVGNVGPSNFTTVAITATP